MEEERKGDTEETGDREGARRCGCRNGTSGLTVTVIPRLVESKGRGVSAHSDFGGLRRGEVRDREGNIVNVFLKFRYRDELCAALPQGVTSPVGLLIEKEQELGPSVERKVCGLNSISPLSKAHRSIAA